MRPSVSTVSLSLDVCENKVIIASTNRVMKTNMMQYLSLVYFVNQPLHVSGIFVAHHQEVYFTGLFEMIVGVLTTCHTQYTGDRSICLLLFNRKTVCSMSAVMVSMAVLIRTFSSGILAGRGGT